MANVVLVKLVLLIAAILAVVRLVHLLRARAMRAFAARLGFRYIGPGAPPSWWWNPAHLRIPSPLPSRISHLHPRIRQVWNVIEGERNGVSILIFDSVIGEYKGGQPCTHIACQTEPNPFGSISSADHVVQAHGWTVLHGVWFLWFSWTMGTKRIADHLEELSHL